MAWPVDSDRFRRAAWENHFGPQSETSRWHTSGHDVLPILRALLDEYTPTTAAAPTRQSQSQTDAGGEWLFDGPTDEESDEERQAPPNDEVWNRDYFMESRGIDSLSSSALDVRDDLPRHALQMHGRKVVGMGGCQA